MGTHFSQLIAKFVPRAFFKDFVGRVLFLLLFLLFRCILLKLSKCQSCLCCFLSSLFLSFSPPFICFFRSAYLSLFLCTFHVFFPLLLCFLYIYILPIYCLFLCICSQFPLSFFFFYCTIIILSPNVPFLCSLSFSLSRFVTSIYMPMAMHFICQFIHLFNSSLSLALSLSLSGSVSLSHSLYFLILYLFYFHYFIFVSRHFSLWCKPWKSALQQCDFPGVSPYAIFNKETNIIYLHL